MHALSLTRLVVLAAALPCAAGCTSNTAHAAPAAAGGAQARTWSFETDAVGAAPAGFSFARTGGGPPGSWVVRAVADAPDGRNVLAQVNADDTDMRFPVAVADGPELADLRLSVRGRPLTGVVDQAIGLVFRYRDADNYYIARANVLEDNVRLYHITHGVRQQIASWKGTVAPARWHTLAVDARGDHLTVSYDGVVVIDTHDDTLQGPGRVGVWTKADAVSEFDLLSVEPLGS